MQRHELVAEIDRYLEDEIGTIYKTAPKRVALVYPSPYRIGMSSLGFQTLYRALNERPEISCERAFLPDDPDEYRESRTPLMTFESKAFVSEMDIIGLSVAYETEILGVIESLDLAGIPRRAEQRKDGAWPLVIGGGPLTFSNPLPIAPFVDLIIMGEADELIHLVVDAWFEASTRDEFYDAVELLPGVYVPTRHGETLRTVAQANDKFLPAYSAIITPNTELRSMHLVENARGCHRGCTFCVMRRSTNGGMRAVDAENVLATIPDYAERVGLVGAATTDHPQIKTILKAIVESGREVGLSSLRADRLDDEFMSLLAKGGARTLTVASDGTSARMRKIAKKGIKDKHLIHAAKLVRDHGLKMLKLYMVIGYPEETEDDVKAMCEFVHELSQICPVALGMSPLVSKKNTPLDGIPLWNQKELEGWIKLVHNEIGSDVDIRSTSVRWAAIEYYLAQGGWQIADVAEMAYEGGGSFGAWRKALKSIEFDPLPLSRPGERLRFGARL